MAEKKTSVVIATRVSPSEADAAYKCAQAHQTTVGDMLREGLRTVMARQQSVNSDHEDC